jgi:hypothetical protein
MNDDAFSWRSKIEARLEVLEKASLSGAPPDIVTALSSLGSRIAALEAKIDAPHELQIALITLDAAIHRAFKEMINISNNLDTVLRETLK